MIIGQPIHKVITYLQSLSDKFYLTGSRAFGTSKEHSDWDYFAQDSDMLRQKLTSFGFELDDMAGYTTSSVVFRCLNVHVQLVPNAALKERVQSEIANNMFLLALIRTSDKQVHKSLWSYLLTTIE
jgi:hypothetical protein